MAFELNRDGSWLDEILAGGELTGMVTGLGEQVVTIAKDNAAEHERTGAFRESIHGELQRSPKTGRPWYRVVSDDPAALSIEFGTKDNAAHRDLGRAIGAIGGDG